MDRPFPILASGCIVEIRGWFDEAYGNDIPAGQAERIMDPDAHDLTGIYNDDVQEVFIRNLMEASERMLVRNGEGA